MKKESQNYESLRDYTRDHGAPNCLFSDNAQSQVGVNWQKHCRELCIERKTTEPHSPWQHPAEHPVGTFGNMIRRTMRHSGAPMGVHNWC